MLFAAMFSTNDSISVFHFGSRIQILLIAFAMTVCIKASSSAEEDRLSDERPNFVIVLADDLGWTDLGCQGSEYYETPHIDRLADEGLTLSSFYVCQNCAPTRAALMSGQYAPRTGVYTVGSFDRGKAQNRGMNTPPNLTQLPLDKITFAQLLQSEGYVTGMFGKWHLGTDEEHHPAQRGFTEAIVSNGRHFKIRTNPSVEVDPATYMADFVTDRAVDFIERHQDEHFLLYVPHFAVHTPIQAKEELITRYREKDPVGGHNNPTYAAMIHSVDESVGRIVEALEAAGIRDNTMVIFMSDNGGLGGYNIPGTDRRKGITDNTPLRGGKGNLYEGGVRVPWIASWPDAIPAGSSSDQPAVHVDLYPTLLELANVDPPADYPLDGTSIAALLKNPDAGIEHGPIYWHFPGYLESYIPEDTWRTTPVSTIRDGDFKLLEFFEDNRIELYNLKEDIGETNNLAQEMPEKTKELHDRLKQWREETNALMATHKTDSHREDNESSR